MNRASPVPVLLVVAKAPVAGLAKTRLAAAVGDAHAADFAAAALLDTLAVGRTLGWPVVVAMTGDLRGAARRTEIMAALHNCQVVPQQGDGFGERLAAAHRDAAVVGRREGASGVVQIGMDTPQVTADDLRAAASTLADAGAVLGPASDGGWWLLGVHDPADAAALAHVPMSRDDTATRTAATLPAPVARLRELIDVDEWDDAVALAEAHPHLLASAAVRSTLSTLPTVPIGKGTR